MNSPVVDFEAEDLVATAERASAEEIDGWEFGVVKLNADDTVAIHNQAEKRLSGFKGRPALGRYFFVDVAPCMNTEDFHGRIEHARQDGAIDIEFGWIGDFGDVDRELHVRVLSATDGGMWIFIRRV